MKLTVYKDAPDTVFVKEFFGHAGHDPGSAEDLAYLQLGDKLESKLVQVSIAVLLPYYLNLLIQISVTSSC